MLLKETINISGELYGLMEATFWMNLLLYADLYACLDFFDLVLCESALDYNVRALFSTTLTNAEK